MKMFGEDSQEGMKLLIKARTSPFILKCSIRISNFSRVYISKQQNYLAVGHRIPMGAWLFGHTQSNPRICRLILASEVPLAVVTLLLFALWFCLAPLHQRVSALLVIPEAALLHSKRRVYPESGQRD